MTASPLDLTEKLITEEVVIHAAGDLRIVKREKGQAMPAAVPASQVLHLPCAELAVAVVDHHVGVWIFLRR